ncbi:MAG: RecX family transcriptional regulator [Bacteroidaceae bacterium]|nr:RecX family transcriptional regulator [Bacteroidaceae bacterium]MBR4338980.1 RecX family transcriptional regulator [Bacteroidaceae bacterium]
MPSADEIFSRLSARCSTAELCLSDIHRKLDATELTDEEKERIIRRLLDEGYVDEARYARAFVRDKFRFSGWGRVKIAQGLHAKQISSADIQEALKEIDDDDYRRALRDAIVAKRRTLRGASDYETNAKLIRFAQSRGYEMAVILKEIKGDGIDLD